MPEGSHSYQKVALAFEFQHHQSYQTPIHQLTVAKSQILGKDSNTSAPPYLLLPSPPQNSPHPPSNPSTWLLLCELASL